MFKVIHQGIGINTLHLVSSQLPCEVHFIAVFGGALVGRWEVGVMRGMGVPRHLSPASEGHTTPVHQIGSAPFSRLTCRIPP